MRKLILAGVALTIGFFGAAAAHEGHEAKATNAKVVEKGEIVDMACFMHDGDHGKAHAKCAGECLLQGAPAGLLKADGSVTLLLEDHAKAKAYKEVAKLGGEQVTVTGQAVSRGGISAILVESVKKG